MAIVGSEIMNIIVLFFFFSLALAQIGAWTVVPGVTVYLHDIALVILLLSFGVMSLHKKRTYPSVAWPILGFFFIGEVSLVFNAWRFTPMQLAISQLYLLRWICYAALVWVVSLNSVSVPFWFYGLYSTGVMIAGAGMLQYFLYPDLRNLYYLGWDPHLYRVFSTLLDPNFTGLVLLLTLYLGMYLWSVRNRIWILIANIGVFMTFLLTYSRSSYVALFAGIVTFILLSSSKKYRFPAVIGICMFILLLFFLPRPNGEGVNLLRISTVVARITNVTSGWILFTKSPFMGYGFDTIRYAQGADISSHSGAGVDNSILFILLTTGLVGVVSYAWLYISMYKRIIKVKSKQSSGVLWLLIATSFVSIFTHSMVINSMFYPIVMAWSFILLGCAERFTSDT